MKLIGRPMAIALQTSTKAALTPAQGALGLCWGRIFAVGVTLAVDAIIVVGLFRVFA